MAKSATGKWVSRVGSSGGGKAYKKSRPGNYYGILVVIVVLGLAATLLARYDYQHPSKKAKGTPPAVGTTWFAGLTIQSCGKYLPALAPNPTSSGGFSIQNVNVIKISPVSAADSGNNATLAQFANEYPGMIASNSELAVPNASGKSNAATTYRNGNACPSSSKYAGQSGKVQYAYWSSFGQTTPTITTNPSAIKFSEEMRVAMFFDPAGVAPMLPQQTTVNDMVKAVATGTTTTTAAVTTTTGATGTTTTTTTGTTTTTAKTTTTTAKG